MTFERSIFDPGHERGQGFDVEVQPVPRVLLARDVVLLQVVLQWVEVGLDHVVIPGEKVFAVEARLREVEDGDDGEDDLYFEHVREAIVVVGGGVGGLFDDGTVSL